MTENTSDVGGGRNVGDITTGDWMSYSAVTIPITGVYMVEYRVAGSGGSLQFEKAGGTPVYGWISIPVTGGYQTWTTVSHTVNLNAGSQFFGITATAGGWNLNWFRITNEMNTVSDTSPECSFFFRRQGATSHAVTFDVNIRLPVRAHRRDLDLGATGFRHRRRCCRGLLGNFGGSLRGCQYSRGWSPWSVW